jgi:signal transduction histidine kinase
MSTEPTKVLLVEDNLGDARLLYEGLEEALPDQFRMTHVRRLSEALEYLWEETCDVVLLDLGLPDSHGLDTLVVTRAQAPGVPIVVLTGFQDESLAGEALHGGAQDYLVKGQVDSKLLARSLRYAIVRKATEQALLGQGVAFARAAELQRSRQRLIAADERVRREASTQLHDGVRESLSILKGRLQELLKGTTSASETTRLLSEAIDGLNQVIEQQVGVLSRQLYPATLSQGLVPAFLSFVDRHSAGPVVEVELDEELIRREKAGPNWASEQVKLAMYRIAEQALTNAVHHAGASHATVRLGMSREGWLHLTVRDDGQGFDAQSAPRGQGVATMQDYADAAGGRCVINSTPGAGTEVAVALPLSPPGAEESLEKGGH